ncbi:MAG: serine--tRNA ligase [Candidatus Shapirobacteria bacterium]
MLDINFIREHSEIVKEGVRNKNYDPTVVDRVLRVDETRRELIGKIENLRARRNQLTKGDPEEGKKIKLALQQTEPDLKAVEEELKNLLYEIPNLPSSDTPIGKNETENAEIKKWGVPTKFNFTPKDHVELGKNLGILDFESGSKVAGTGFYFWLGAGAILELALTHYAFDLLSQEGFVPVITPDLARSRFYLGTGYLPKGKEAQTYEIKDTDLGLIATAEVTLAGKHADKIIPEDDLPIKYVGYSHVFRQESGSYGRYSKGIYRVHQLTKTEMFIYCRPEESNRWHEHILAMEEKIYQSLKLPYRVIKMCTGDLGAMAARKFDLEVWMPGRSAYGEVTSASNCTDYQARNLNIKYRRHDGQNEFVHMINGTAIATSRTPLAILENFQQEDGSVLVPEVLQKYTGFGVISPGK